MKAPLRAIRQQSRSRAIVARRSEIEATLLKLEQKRGYRRRARARRRAELAAMKAGLLV